MGWFAKAVANRSEYVELGGVVAFGVALVVIEAIVARNERRLTRRGRSLNPVWRKRYTMTSS